LWAAGRLDVSGNAAAVRCGAEDGDARGSDVVDRGDRCPVRLYADGRVLDGAVRKGLNRRAPQRSRRQCRGRCGLQGRSYGAGRFVRESLARQLSFDLRPRVEDDVADSLQAARADVIEVVLRGVPLRIIEIDDVD